MSRHDSFSHVTIWADWYFQAFSIDSFKALAFAIEVFTNCSKLPQGCDKSAPAKDNTYTTQTIWCTIRYSLTLKHCWADKVMQKCLQDNFLLLTLLHNIVVHIENFCCSTNVTLVRHINALHLKWQYYYRIPMYACMSLRKCFQKT